MIPLVVVWSLGMNEHTPWLVWYGMVWYTLLMNGRPFDTDRGRENCYDTRRSAYRIPTRVVVLNASARCCAGVVSNVSFILPFGEAIPLNSCNYS